MSHIPTQVYGKIYSTLTGSHAGILSHNHNDNQAYKQVRQKLVVDISYLTINDLKLINEKIMKIIEKSDSTIMFPGSLDYCCESVKDLPVSNNIKNEIIKAAAYYLWCIIKNHPFIDGNKRTAYVAMQMFLLLNGYQLEINDIQEIQSEVLRISRFDVRREEIEKWVEKYLRVKQ